MGCQSVKYSAHCWASSKVNCLRAVLKEKKWVPVKAEMRAYSMDHQRAPHWVGYLAMS
jgi:hypothetical protein